jgi:AbrB family looped-hinge helix DNA binding protein
MHHVTKVSAGGRVVIPAPYRKALGIKPGDQLVVRLEDGKLQLWTVEQLRQWAQDLVCARIPRDRSLADELIRERREEAAREEMGS